MTSLRGKPVAIAVARDVDTSAVYARRLGATPWSRVELGTVRIAPARPAREASIVPDDDTRTIVVAADDIVVVHVDARRFIVIGTLLGIVVGGLG
jgi:hypothetical protein